MVYRNSDSNIVRYFSPSVPSTDYAILGFFRNNIHRKIILYLYSNQSKTNFGEIKIHIKKSSSTTSWYLGRLLLCGIIIKSRMSRHSLYAIKDPSLINRIVEMYDCLHSRIDIFDSESLFDYSYQQLQLIKVK